MPPGEKHEQALDEAIEKLKSEGYRIVRTNHKIPDAIAVKDGKIFAVEMMGQRWSSNRAWINKFSKKQKEIDYDNFDGLLFFKFRYEKREKTPKKVGVGGQTSGVQPKSIRSNGIAGWRQAPNSQANRRP